MNNFYHATTRKLITIFGALFNEMEIELDPSKPKYKVPLHFATRDRFLTILEEKLDKYSTTSHKNTVWMAFAFTGMSYATERALPNTYKLKALEEKDYMLNRVPYDLQFELYISTKHLEQSFMIVEQILPIFKPDYNVKVNEIEGFDLDTDISISLDSVQPELENEGQVKEQRKIFWTLSFTMKAYYYPKVDHTVRIKHTLSRLANLQSEQEFFSQLLLDVVPDTATRSDPHTIQETTR